MCPDITTQCLKSSINQNSKDFCGKSKSKLICKDLNTNVINAVFKVFASNKNFESFPFAGLMKVNKKCHITNYIVLTKPYKR